VEFTVPTGKIHPCQGNIKNVESDFFIMVAKDLDSCWEDMEYFRRGTALIFKSPVLQKRVETMSHYRLSLLRRKEDFLKQLNEINDFLWTYDQKKVLTAADYDKKISEIEKEKSKAIDYLQNEREDKVKLRKELAKRIQNLNNDLEYYRISNDEFQEDRWHLDLDMGLPVKSRPQKVKER
jgi:hypothetical protein